MEFLSYVSFVMYMKTPKNVKSAGNRSGTNSKMSHPCRTTGQKERGKVITGKTSYDTTDI